MGPSGAAGEGVGFIEGVHSTPPAGDGKRRQKIRTGAANRAMSATMTEGITPKALLGGLLAIAVAAGTAAGAGFVTFESGQVRPLALSPDGTHLFAVDTPDNRLEILAVDPGTGALSHAASVPVGLEPVAVAARTNTEVWVVNHLSDSVSIVQLTGTGHVVRTLLVGDEPRDIVFAGTPARAFITTAHRGQQRKIGR